MITGKIWMDIYCNIVCNYKQIENTKYLHVMGRLNKIMYCSQNRKQYSYQNNLELNTFQWVDVKNNSE